MGGDQTSTLESPLDEFIWCEIYGLEYMTSMNDILVQISTVYIV